MGGFFSPHDLRGFLSGEDRDKLVALARDWFDAGLGDTARHAVVLLDGGWDAQEVAAALLLDEDTMRGWNKLV